MKVTCAVDKIRKLKPSAVKDILNKDKKGQFLLLDVRQSCEYEAGHIPKAILVPLNELEERQQEIDRDKIVITYSRSGHMSVAAAIVLFQLGFKSLYHLDGGISNWPYGIVTGLPEAKVKSTDDTMNYNKIYMEAMAVEMGFKNPHHFVNNKTIGRAKKAITNLFIGRHKLLTKELNLKSLLVLSIKLEKVHKDFYMMARDKAKSSQAKEIFQTLFDTKTESMKRMYTCACGLAREVTLPALEELEQESEIVYVEDTIEVNPFIAKAYDEISDDMGLLEAAAEKEYVYNDFFRQASVVVEDSVVKEVLSQIATEKKYCANIVTEYIAENIALT